MSTEKRVVGGELTGPGELNKSFQRMGLSIKAKDASLAKVPVRTVWETVLWGYVPTMHCHLLICQRVAMGA